MAWFPRTKEHFAGRHGRGLNVPYYHSLENLTQVIGWNGCYNSIDLAFRPPYKGRALGSSNNF